MSLQIAGNPAHAAVRNAQLRNSKSNIKTIEQRWNETYADLDPITQETVDSLLESAKREFRRRFPGLKKFNKMLLAESKNVLMSSVKIDGTMQRQLNIHWVIELLNKFMETCVVPIQVYRPDPNTDEFLAWDGQHTLVLLWLICTQITGEDPSTVTIPVNVYSSSLKAEMRYNFIVLNSKEGKKMLDLIDLFYQMVLGVRVDNCNHPDWIVAEQKQTLIENAGLFVTKSSFGDTELPGAISRLQEINKLSVTGVSYLVDYLKLSTQLKRPVIEKEIVMMADFFGGICAYNNNPHNTKKIVVDQTYIQDLHSVANGLWGCDFSPHGKFWNQASIAFGRWHNIHSSSMYGPKFSKEPSHGMPFLTAQLQKSFGHPVPPSRSNSPFWPDQSDLF